MSKAVRDKWRAKKWYQVIAPAVFSNMVLGSTPADDPDKVIGRTIEATLFDLIGDIAYSHVKLKFQVIRVEGTTAYTRFKGHELLRDYVRSLTRRRSSKVATIFEVFTKDGYGLRLTVVAWTRFKCQTSQKKAMRKAMREVLTERIKELTLDEMIPLMIQSDREGSLAQLAERAARKIYPTRKVEIIKSKLLYVPGERGPEKAVVISPIELKRS